MEEMSKIFAIVTVGGFAIQQVLELLNPLVSILIRKVIAGRTTTDAALSEAEIKKWWMAMLALLLGAGTVLLTEISLLKPIEDSLGNTPFDFLITALVLGAGTEGFNTLTKYFGYAKEGKKAALAPKVEVAIVPSSVELGREQTFKFRSVVKNSSNETVTWEVAHGSGGSIDKQNGLYTAPNIVGTFNVVAVSQADKAKHSIATIKVT